ncbi:MAG: oxygen-independent coproporphyrinogen III oxidase [Marinifilaceae bacterium]
MNISKELLEKYNKPVPRYTSYPPANFFKNEFSHDDYTRSIIESNNEKPENISIYIHIPFCHKICHYCGCNNANMRKSSDIRAYVDAVIGEMQMAFEFIEGDRKVSQIHYGGGTPNAIEAQYLAEINNFIFESFELVEHAEIAVECNPSLLTEKYIEQLREAGFNRFSIGIQDFNKDVLKVINRDASYIPVPELIPLLKYNNKDISVNLDFIYGLPYQTVESFEDAIRKAIEAKADRIVTFSYAHVPWVNKAQLILEKAGLPQANDKIMMYNAAYNLLTSNGYEAIGLDHYALKTDKLSKALKNGDLHRNFQGYCTTQTTGQVYAFGVSAISQFESAFVQNTKNIDEYIELIEDETFACVKGYILNKDEKIIKAIIDEVMCNKQLSYSYIKTKLDIDKETLAKFVNPALPQLRELAKDGIIIMNEDGLKVNEEEILFIRNVAAAFDPLVRNKQGSFSKPV